MPEAAMTPAAMTPAAMTPVAVDSERTEPLDRAVLAALEGGVPPVPAPLPYRLGLAAVALAMVALPLVYVSLIGLVGWLVYQHAVGNAELLGGRMVGIIIYLGPIVAGAILILFMIKPLFAPAVERPEQRRLRPEEEPLLFAFVSRLAHLLGAPRPAEVQVNCEVNASASLRRGLFSRDLTLTIGLPLVAGLDLRQLAGVLAHELGHFAQGAGMRLTYLIRRVSFWFARTVYERDAWDRGLARYASEIDARIGIILHFARLLVWLTRKILWVLMSIGNLISCYMLRQMEYDADRYEALLSGSDTFEATARRLPLLAVATQGALADLQSSWRESRLADDFPSLMLANEKQIPASVGEAVAKSLDEEKTGALETHPSTRDRIAAVQRRPTPGVFRHEGPAAQLFQDFARLCRETSLDYYKELVGPEVEPSQLVPVGELVAGEERKAQELKACARYSQGVSSALRPLWLPAGLEVGASLEQTRELLVEGRERLVGGRVSYEEAFKRYDALDTQLLELAQAEAVLEAGFKLQEGGFGLERPSLEECRAAKERAAAEQRSLAGTLEPLERVASERLLGALGLLLRPEAAAGLEDAAAVLDEVSRLLPIFSRVAALLPAATALRDHCVSLNLLASQLEAHSGDESLVRTLADRMDRCRGKLEELRKGAGEVPCHFESGRGQSLGQHLVSSLPEPGELGELLSRGRQASERLYSSYYQVLGRLAVIAERVEQSIGLDPLPDPPPQDATETSDAL